MVRYRNRLYLFGGYSEGVSTTCEEGEGDEGVDDYPYEQHPFLAGPHYNNVYEFNMDTRRWKELVTTSVCGNMPRCRRSCSVIEHSGSLYIFGGATSTHEQLNDMWEFNIERREWKQVEYNSGKIRAYRHSVRKSHVCLRPTRRRTQVWRNPCVRFERKNKELPTVFPETLPLPVANIPQFYTPTGKRVREGSKAITDMHRFDLISHTWTEVSIDETESPLALQLHTAVVSEGRLYVHSRWKG